MKFSDPFDRLRKYLAGNIPQPMSPEEQLARARAEQQRRALAAKAERAERLRPIVDRLLLVTDFGNYAEDEHTDRVALTVLSDEIFDAGTPIGISSHVMRSRGAEARLWPQQTAARLLEKLGSLVISIYCRI